MSPEAQRLAITEACGLNPYRWRFYFYHENGGDFSEHYTSSIEAEAERKVYEGEPVECIIVFTRDWLNDLNAMHTAEKTLTKRVDRCEYTRWLNNLVGHKFTWEATAAQRAEAFLRTIGKWDDSK